VPIPTENAFLLLVHVVTTAVQDPWKASQTVTARTHCLTLQHNISKNMSFFLIKSNVNFFFFIKSRTKRFKVKIGNSGHKRVKNLKVS